ncbi:MAG: glycoside hydrolase family 99-like domain-containing protein [Opitutaceae bacterium]
MSDDLTKLIAFYLPQYHTVPENDEWWGKGFTEWRNVARARPLFRGHYQPHLPADLGFYDLRVPEVRQAQAAMARQYGIGAFCYYHYWFNGRRILERPFNEVLASGEPDFPFCLCWANENWTRAWDGGSRQVLLAQAYSDADDEAHFHALLPAWLDPRYLRHDGRPVFLVYAASQLPDPLRTTTRWRELARTHGLPGLYLLRVESVHEERTDPRPLGFDAAVEFQPDWRRLSEPRWRHYRRRLVQKLGLQPPRSWQQHIRDYREVVDIALAKPVPSYPSFPCVTPSWDNSARRTTGASILRDCAPAIYESWLRQVIERQKPEFVFINAWNEWAEGCHLEPCQRFGLAYLEATQRALRPATSAQAEVRRAAPRFSPP